ncbi:NAD(P)-binding protein [Amylocystis lapponica]|nr:NAD(P)-binding protein [Amylocystis lapponica]
MWPPKPKFNADQIPDLTGKVIIVTGGNLGIGKETIKVLLQHNAKVYMASRNRDKACAAVQELRAETNREAIFLELDLSNLASVRKAAEEFLSHETELHVLFNNAGVMCTPRNQTTVDGYDLQFGTNVVGPFLFTQLLMPTLIAGAKASPDGRARIITTSSGAAYWHTLNWDSFRDGPRRRRMSPEALYAQSKFANVVVAHELAKRYADKGVLSLSCNPGNLRTGLFRELPSVQRKLMFMIMYPPPLGALTQLWGGTMPEAVNHNGEYLIPWARVGKCRKEAYDAEIGRRLWEWLEAEVRGK